MPAAQGYNSPAEKETFRALVRHEIAKSTSDRDEEDNKKREIIRGNWTRINGMLMQKHPAQVSETFFVHVTTMYLRARLVV